MFRNSGIFYVLIVTKDKIKDIEYYYVLCAMCCVRSKELYRYEFLCESERENA